MEGARRTIVVGSVKTDLLEIGAGQPLLFLHGAEGPDFPDARYLDELARNFHVLAPWHPGFGFNERPAHMRDVGDLAYFYLDLIELLALKNLILVGASFGGWIAAEIAVRSDRALAALVLAGPFGIKLGDRQARDIVDFFAISRADMGRLFFTDDRFFAPDLTSKSNEELTAIARGRDALAAYGWSPFMHNPQLSHWLHRIHVPTLVLRGDDDRVVNVQCHEAYAERVCSGTLQTIANAGHYPHIEQPVAFTDAIRSFASSHVSQAACG